MRSRSTYWRGIPGRIIALAILTLALDVAVGTAPAANAASASCGTAQSGCGPQVCTPITPADYTLPTTSPRGGVRARLSRVSGVSGSTDTLTGSGWPAGATVELLLGSYQGGSIWINPAPFAQGAADASGHVTITTFQTPPVEECTTKDGAHFGDNQTLFVAQTTNGRARVSLLYTFYPSPTLSLQTSVMSVISAGEAIQMTGSGWEPGQMVTITPAYQRWPANGYPSYDLSSFQPLPADATTATAKSDGTLTASATIPQEPPETQIIFIATASGPRNGSVTVQSNSIFTIYPSSATTLALSSATAYAGGAVTVTGTNWPAGQDILISYCRGHVAFCPSELSDRLAFVNADGSGRITATVHIPTDAQPGPITIQANPLASPFDNAVYAQAQPFAVLYPFAQAHPRLALALRVLPYATTALILALIALGAWLIARRRRGPALAARL